MLRTGQAGTMNTSIFLCLLIILLTKGSPAAFAGDNSSASHSTASTAEKPVLLDNVADAEAFITGAEVAVIGFFQEPEGPEASQFLLTAGRIPEVPFGLSTSSAVLSHYGVEANTVTLFRMVDNQRRDLDMNNNDIDAEKMTRFIRINELRLVTEYNPVGMKNSWLQVSRYEAAETILTLSTLEYPGPGVAEILDSSPSYTQLNAKETAIGVMQSSFQLHLLLVTDKTSPKYPEQIRRYREAAELFKGKILFILVDINLKSNERTVSFFKLKKSQLPALAIFNPPDEEQDVLTLDEVSVERIQDFCNGFIERMEKGEDEPEEKAPNEEL